MPMHSGRPNQSENTIAESSMLNLADLEAFINLVIAPLLASIIIIREGIVQQVLESTTRERAVS